MIVMVFSPQTNKVTFNLTPEIKYQVFLCSCPFNPFLGFLILKKILGIQISWNGAELFFCAFLVLLLNHMVVFIFSDFCSEASCSPGIP